MRSLIFSFYHVRSFFVLYFLRAMANKGRKNRSFFKDEERQTQTRASNIIAAKGVYHHAAIDQE